MIKKIIGVASFLLFSFSFIFAQDDSRLSLRFGYAKNIKAEDVDFINAKRIGLEVSTRFYEIGGMHAGVEYQSAKSIVGYLTLGGISRPINANIDVLSFYLGFNRHDIIFDKLDSKIGLCFDFDVSYPDISFYKPLNGLGFYTNLSYNIHFSETLMASIIPHFAWRSGLPFNARGYKDVFVPGLWYGEYGLYLSFSYKFY